MRGRQGAGPIFNPLLTCIVSVSGCAEQNRVDQTLFATLAVSGQNGDRYGERALAAAPNLRLTRALDPHTGKNKRLTKSKKGGKKKTCV